MIEKYNMTDAVLRTDRICGLQESNARQKIQSLVLFIQTADCAS
jgi:hypothetical protein